MTVIVQRPMNLFARAASYLLSGLLLALTAALIMEGALAIPLFWAWLISINVFTMIFYWIDKINAEWVGDNEARVALKMRIPEPTLLLLAAAGGSLGAVLMMFFRRHKKSKSGFKAWIVLIVLAQVVAAYMLRDRLPWP